MGENLIKTITTKSHQGELRIWRGRKLIGLGVSLELIQRWYLPTSCLTPPGTSSWQQAATDALITKAWWPMTEVEQ